MAATRAAGGKRGYSRAFTPHKNAKRRGFYIDRIPPMLHAAITRRARLEGVAIRSLVLTYLGEWSGWSDKIAHDLRAEHAANRKAAAR